MDAISPGIEVVLSIEVHGNVVHVDGYKCRSSHFFENAVGYTWTWGDGTDSEMGIEAGSDPYFLRRRLTQGLVSADPLGRRREGRREFTPFLSRSSHP